MDETLDAGAVPADLFTLKLPAGAKLVDVASQASAAQVNGTPQPEFHNGWYEFSPDTAFSVLMPRTPDHSTTGSSVNGSANGTVPSQSVQMYGVKQGPIAYVLKYTDYPQELINKVGVQKWLDNERDYIVVGVPCKLLGERPISMDGYPGRELEVKADDGKYRICRIYLVGSRFYNVYVVMPDKGSVTPDIQRYLGSLKLTR